MTDFLRHFTNSAPWSDHTFDTMEVVSFVGHAELKSGSGKFSLRTHVMLVMSRVGQLYSP